MKGLSEKDKTFVALGAALGSNCIPCIVYHVAAIKKLGVADEEIEEAVEVADKVRMVPATQVIRTAYAQIGKTIKKSTETKKTSTRDCGC